MTILAALALAAASMATPGSSVTTIYAPYLAGQNGAPASERAIYARPVRALIARWFKLSTAIGEVDALNDFDWLCGCQDGDPKTYRGKIIARRMLAPGLAELRVVVRVTERAPYMARLRLRREAGRWLIEDLFSADFKQGLQAALRSTIADDTKLLQAKGSPQ
jgi:hypothetical protein